MQGHEPRIIEFLTGRQILHAARLADARGYNRQLDAEHRLLVYPETKYPIIFSMVHEHAAGVKVDPHQRCIFYSPEFPGEQFTLDVDMDIYKAAEQWDRTRTMSGQKLQDDGQGVGRA